MNFVKYNKKNVTCGFISSEKSPDISSVCKIARNKSTCTWSTTADAYFV